MKTARCENENSFPMKLSETCDLWSDSNPRFETPNLLFISHVSLTSLVNLSTTWCPYVSNEDTSKRSAKDR